MSFTIDKGRVTTLDLGGNNEMRFCRQGPMLYNKHDMYVGHSLRQYGEYCPEEARVLAQLIDDESVVVEVGANIGAHTVGLAKRALKVIAIEPQRLCFQILCANVALNNLTNVYAINAAAGYSGEWVTVAQPEPSVTNNFGSLSLLDPVPPEAISDRVPCLKVDSLDGPIHLLKIDVEGMEHEVLRGAAKTIRRDRPVIYCENDRDGKGQPLIDLLRGHGYKLYWHLPFLFDDTNYAGNQINDFPGVMSQNMLCMPEERAFQTNMTEVVNDGDIVRQQAH